MKIAVMLTGHVRTYKKTHKSLFKFFLKNNIDYDIFIDCWDITGERIGSKTKERLVDTKIDIDKIKEIYQPKYMNVEDCYGWLGDNKKKSKKIEKEIGITNQKINIIGGHLSQNYKINSCFNAIKDYSIANNVKYDVVVRLRFDIAFNGHFNIGDFVNDLDENVFFSTFTNKRNKNKDNNKDNNLKIAKKHNVLITDSFNFGSMKNMEVYSSVYPNYVKLTKDFLKITNISPNEYNIEFIVGHSLVSNGIKPKEISAPIELKKRGL